jgi:hypothetical protein
LKTLGIALLVPALALAADNPITTIQLVEARYPKNKPETVQCVYKEAGNVFPVVSVYMLSLPIGSSCPVLTTYLARDSVPPPPSAGAR